MPSSRPSSNWNNRRMPLPRRCTKASKLRLALDDPGADFRDGQWEAIEKLVQESGRLLVVDPSIADAHTGHGIVMPQCHHGGPGRAGNGEELGGLNGLRLYHQRLAVQGSTELIAGLQAKAAALH